MLVIVKRLHRSFVIYCIYSNKPLESVTLDPNLP
jgi:hypothetical protein